MFSKFSRSWQLVKASASVLRQDHAAELYRFATDNPNPGAFDADL